MKGGSNQSPFLRHRQCSQTNLHCKKFNLYVIVACCCAGSLVFDSPEVIMAMALANYRGKVTKSRHPSVYNEAMLSSHWMIPLRYHLTRHKWKAGCSSPNRSNSECIHTAIWSGSDITDKQMLAVHKQTVVEALYWMLQGCEGAPPASRRSISSGNAKQTSPEKVPALYSESCISPQSDTTRRKVFFSAGVSWKRFWCWRALRWSIKLVFSTSGVAHDNASLKFWPRDCKSAWPSFELHVCT